MSVSKRLSERRQYLLWPARGVSMYRSVAPKGLDGAVSYLQCSSCLYQELINLDADSPSLRCPHCGELLGDDTGNHPVFF